MTGRYRALRLYALERVPLSRPRVFMARLKDFSSERETLSLSLSDYLFLSLPNCLLVAHTVRRSRHATETNSLSYGSDETSNPKVELKFHGRVLPATINDVFLPHSLLPLIFSLLLLLSRECARSMCVRGVFRCGEDRRGTLNHRPIPSPR